MCKTDGTLRFCLCDPDTKPHPPYWRIERVGPEAPFVMGRVSLGALMREPDALEAELLRRLNEDAMFDLADELQSGDTLTLVLSDRRQFRYSYTLEDGRREHHETRGSLSSNGGSGFIAPLEAGPPRRLQGCWSTQRIGIGRHIADVQVAAGTFGEDGDTRAQSSSSPNNTL